MEILTVEGQKLSNTCAHIDPPPPQISMVVCIGIALPWVPDEPRKARANASEH